MSRIDHVGLVVADIDRCVSFFTALGLQEQARQEVSGDWVGRVIGLDDVASTVVGLGYPGQEAWLELSCFHQPADEQPAPLEPPNRRGLRHLCLQLDDLDAALAAASELGYRPVADVVDHEYFRLCYLRGPEEVIVELAQPR